MAKKVEELKVSGTGVVAVLEDKNTIDWK